MLTRGWALTELSDFLDLETVDWMVQSRTWHGLQGYLQYGFVQNNGGTVSVQDGELILRGSSTSTGGSYEIAPGAVIDFESGTHTLDAASTLDVPFGATVDFGSAVDLDLAYNAAGTTLVTGGQTNLNAASNQMALLTLSGATWPPRGI